MGQRLSYVGELGFEIYIENKDAKEIYQLIVEEGKNHNLSHCGSHAMDTMRMESGFLHWGHDISPEENQYEAGLNFAISYKKEINFIGKESLLKIKDKKQNRRFIMLSLKIVSQVTIYYYMKSQFILKIKLLEEQLLEIIPLIIKKIYLLDM